VNSGHQAFHNTELIVDNLSQRSQAVGGAGSVGNNLHVLGVLIQVYAANKGRSFLILSGSGNNNLLGTGLNVSGSLFRGAEYAGRLNNILGAALAPRDLFGIHAAINIDSLAVYNQLAVFFLDAAVKSAMDGIILHHVYHIVGVYERIVHAYNLKRFRLSDSSTEHQTTDTSETIDANFNCHNNLTS